MTLILGLRLFSANHAKYGVEARDEDNLPIGRLLETNVDHQYPALKNVIDYLTESGTLPETRPGHAFKTNDGENLTVGEVNCRLFWCEVETDRPLSFWKTWYGVEVALSREDVEHFADRNRFEPAYMGNIAKANSPVLSALH